MGLRNPHFTTKYPKITEIKRDWHYVDATNLVLGRVASKIAAILKGKNKSYYSPHLDCGDYVIVLNAEKIILKGDKLDKKVYVRFSGYPGGKKEEIAKNLLNRNPAAIIEIAVKGMLPKNRVGRKMFKKLFVYKGEQHPHQAQQPKKLLL